MSPTPSNLSISESNEASRILSDITVWSKYAKYLPDKKRREVWSEIVDRNAAMHIAKFPQLEDEIRAAYQFVHDKKVLPSMRSLQFAGRPIDVNPARIFNCSFVAMDDPAAFSELIFLLLAGCGVGYSVQKHHVAKLPTITKPTKTKRYLIGDSIEGWADAVKVLFSAYYEGKPLPVFDLRAIRPKGARLLTSGGIAPGPEPLKDCLHNIQKILDRKQSGEQLTTLEVHDINCYMADAVLAGGIRRAAMLALFSFTDDEMLSCKFGNWWELNPQRGRANNSAAILRYKIKKPAFLDLWKRIEASGSGEPGLFFTNDTNWGTNPCGEISLRSMQFCNLVSINAGTVIDQDDFNARAKAAAFIATLQSSYTNFHYLREGWKTITEKEALIGVSMTGIASGPVMALNQQEAAKVVTDENARVAKLIGINKAARCTTVKPEGTASLVVGTSSGIHAWHNDYYLRRMRVGKNESIYAHMRVNHPDLVEDEFFRPTQQAVISIPQKAPAGAITRSETAIQLLERVAHVWSNWIEPGHRKGANYNNVSTTVTIKPNEWEEVGEWMWTNRDKFTGLSVLPHADHTYVQAPFEDITEEQYKKLIKKLLKDEPFNVESIVELDDQTTQKESIACGGGSCELQ